MYGLGLLRVTCQECGWSREGKDVSYDVMDHTAYGHTRYTTELVRLYGAALESQQTGRRRH